jgi:hypothetical protein
MLLRERSTRTRIETNAVAFEEVSRPQLHTLLKLVHILPMFTWSALLVFLRAAPCAARSTLWTFLKMLQDVLFDDRWMT